MLFKKKCNSCCGYLYLFPMLNMTFLHLSQPERFLFATICTACVFFLRMLHVIQCEITYLYVYKSVFCKTHWQVCHHVSVEQRSWKRLLMLQ